PARRSDGGSGNRRFPSSKLLLDAAASGRGPVRPAGLHHPLHRPVRRPVPGGVRAAVAAVRLQAQALELPEPVPVPVPALGRPAHHTLLLLLPQHGPGQPPACRRLLAALLLPRVSAVLHLQPHQPLLHPGQFWGRIVGSNAASALLKGFCCVAAPQVFLKISAASDTKLWVARCAYAAISVIFLCINVTCAALGERGSSGEKGKRTWKLVLVRVIVNDLLFIMEAVLLAATLLLLTRQPRSFSPYLMSKGTTVCRTAVLGAAVILLFFSRACYNLTVLFLSQSYKVESFDYDWYNVSDQADLQSELGDRGYLAFGAILFIWELLPTSLLILFFRVRRPTQETSSLDINNRVLPRPYFFDDPEGSDDEIPAPWARSPAQNQSWYGSETAPLLFANNPADQSHQHHSFYSTPQN
uniref:G protein-coupled receptor 137 n=1 Tax=Xiphophorus maculatus TaxID=8083 RepID=A0A3B5RAX1_XIPMA